MVRQHEVVPVRLDANEQEPQEWRRGQVEPTGLFLGAGIGQRLYPILLR